MTDFGTCPAYGTQCEYVSQVEALNAENARLREALLVASVALSMIDAPPQNEARAIVDAALAQETQP